MAYWLIKSDPESYSINDLIRDSETVWDGIRNYQARNYILEMKKGDTLLIYHSQNERAVVGYAELTVESFHDDSSDDPRWLAVKIGNAKVMRNPVNLETIKSNLKLKNMLLLKQSRLSVMPVTTEEYKTILSLGK